MGFIGKWLGIKKPEAPPVPTLDPNVVNQNEEDIEDAAAKKKKKKDLLAQGKNSLTIDLGTTKTGIAKGATAGSGLSVSKG